MATKGQLYRRTGMMVSILALLAQPAMAAEPSAAQTRAERSQSRAERAKLRAAARQAARDARRAARRARGQAQAQRADRKSSPQAQDGDVVVVGLKESVAKSIDRKRRARQQVDVVTAEDAGKLPDNNVVEAMARITGITVTRSQGRANGFNIRGLAGVQTTVNGIEGATAALPGGEGRTLALETVPAELVGAIEVYKTRTADQIEGGVGGSVNIQLRRPLDLLKGWTVAGGVRQTYAEQGKQWSPSYTGLVANRFDTGLGEMGILINGGWGRARYAEAYNTSESPDLLGWDEARIRLSLPADIRKTVVAPYLARYGTNDGERTQVSLSTAFQWRASDKLSFVLEGSYFGERYSDRQSTLFVRTREDNYVVSNLRVSPTGALLGYDITNPPFGTGPAGRIVAGFEGDDRRGTSSNYRANFETVFQVDGLRIEGLAQYQWSNSFSNGRGHGGSYDGLSSVRVDFDSPKVFGRGPFFEFNVSPTNPAQARVLSLRDNLGRGSNQNFSSEVKVLKRLSTNGLLRHATFGARYARTTNTYRDSYRYAGYNWPPERALPFSVVPGASAVSVTPDLPGGSPLSWIQLDNRKLYDSWDQVAKFITTSNYEFLDGPGRDAGAQKLWATVRPDSANPGYTSDALENIFAAYGTIDYAFKALLPIDGNVGVRYVNTWSRVEGFNNRPGAQILDPVTKLPTGQFLPDVQTLDVAGGNAIDILPSAFLRAHFTDKLSLRASYSFNVQRPGWFSLRNFLNIDYRNPGSAVYAGNPELVPSTTDNYDVALEWYPAPGAIVSVAGFIKDQSRVIQYTSLLEPVPELGGAIRQVFQERNFGPGRVRGIEAQATGFFRFLPGFLKNFGATANVTFIPVSDVSLPVERPRANPTDQVTYDERRFPSPYTSKWAYNLIGYYETNAFGVRVTYNRRSSYRTWVDPTIQRWGRVSFPTQRLDAAVNYTPFRFVTLSIEANNILRNRDQEYYMVYPDLPIGLRAMGRTITGSARFRF